MNVKILQELKQDKQDSLWYGGNLASITYKGVEFILAAQGIVAGDIYINGEYVTSFKDKENKGDFHRVINEYTPIKNDEMLRKWISFDYVTDDTLKSTPNVIYLDNNNWFEVSAIKDGQFVDLGLILNDENVTDAIEKIKDSIDLLYRSMTWD